MYRNLCLETLENEEWKPIKEHNGYEVSSLGRIKSVRETIIQKNGIIKTKKEKILKQSFSSTGYLKVKIEHKDMKVHRIVAESFLPHSERKNVVNHIDFNPTNNNVNNLEWCTQKENVAWSVKNFRNKKYNNIDKDLAIQKYKQGASAKEIANELNVPKHVITNLVTKRKISRKTYKKKSKYISVEELKLLFQSGATNKYISEIYNIPSAYIARRRYQVNKGEI